MAGVRRRAGDTVDGIFGGGGGGGGGPAATSSTGVLGVAGRDVGGEASSTGSDMGECENGFESTRPAKMC